MTFKSRTSHRLPDITTATALYLGETAVDAAYLGETEMFSSGAYDVGDLILMETGEFLLLETSDKILIDF